jgi:prepilin-type N-terminal cleavage/methylation domain-containing protein
METLQSHAVTTSLIRPARRRSSNAGFSILEVLVAITVLAIGISAMAALVAQTLNGTERARYMALATTLASEKLEDLSRYPTASPVVTQLAAGGSLSSDSTGYNDNVDLSNTTGQIAESIPTSTGYSNIIHQATGEVDVVPNATSPPTGGSGTMVFHRQWLIEADPVVNGVTLTGSRRITVLVTMPNQSLSPPISFQMSSVRQ